MTKFYKKSYKRECPRCKVKFIARRKDKIFCRRQCKNKISKNKYLTHRKKYCEECNFIPKNMCQLDIDHIDGNHENNDINNLRTLCANCHRLKTMIERTNHDEKLLSQN